MNDSLEQLASQIGLSNPGHERLRLTFAHACVVRVRHLLEEPQVVECLAVLGNYLDGKVDDATFSAAQKEAERLANHHSGSKSIDGCGHAAVSASYAIANALNGKALQAASYAAYALVYAEGGSAVVAQREAFEPEFAWQLNALKGLAAGTLTAA